MRNVQRTELSPAGPPPPKLLDPVRRALQSIDVAIEPLAALPPRVLADLREALDESTVPYAVDLVDLTAAPPASRERVRREGIPWTD